MKESKKIYFENLESIRFLAAMIVAFHHFYFLKEYLFSKQNIISSLSLILIDGQIGMLLFFTLSGFLITYLLQMEFEKYKSINIRNFYLRRILRIWPLYFLVLIIGFWLLPHEFINTSSVKIYYFAFLSNFYIIHLEAFRLPIFLTTDITWSVSIEEQFYLFWPLIFKFSNQKKWIYLVMIIVAISLVFIFFNQSNDSVIHFHSLSNLLYLSSGGLIALLVLKFANIRRFFENTNSGFHISLLGLFFVLQFFKPKLVEFFYYGHFFYCVGFAMLSLCLIASQALTKQSSLFNLKNIKPAFLLGKYTYSIYLTHPLSLLFTTYVWNVLLQKSLKQFEMIQIISFSLIYFLVVLVVAILSYHIFESYFLKLKNQYSLFIKA